MAVAVAVAEDATAPRRFLFSRAPASRQSGRFAAALSVFFSFGVAFVFAIVPWVEFENKQTNKNKWPEESVSVCVCVCVCVRVALFAGDETLNSSAAMSSAARRHSSGGGGQVSPSPPPPPPPLPPLPPPPPVASSSGGGGAYFNGCGRADQSAQVAPVLRIHNNKKATIRQHYYPEGGWGWVVAVASSLVLAIGHGLQLGLAAALPGLLRPPAAAATAAGAATGAVERRPPAAWPPPAAAWSSLPARGPLPLCRFHGFFSFATPDWLPAVPRPISGRPLVRIA